MKNGEFWYDTDGNVIHAHGGWILKVGDYYYWYGENRTGDNFVSCYRTKDFKSFEFRNNCLTAHSKMEKSHVSDAELTLKIPMSSFGENTQKLGVMRVNDQDELLINIERPKVLYCKKTKKYVMWMHFENGHNYNAASCAVATCDTPDGDFIYHGSFKPFGNMAMDCTVFEDGDDAYFIAAARNDRDLYIYRLTEDYLSVEDTVKVLFQNASREAPAFFKRNGEIFLLSSGCTGWKPNQGKFAKTREGKIDGRWSILYDFGDEVTYRSQPSFVLPIDKDGVTEYYYFGDRWGTTSQEYFNSTYVVLKIKFDQDGNPYIDYNEDAEMPEI
jgi:hypothetical protein